MTADGLAHTARNQLPAFAPQNMVSVRNDAQRRAIDIDVSSIGTSEEAAGDNELVSHKGGVVVDTVTYRNLIPGQQYTFRGELMDKATGEGTGITAEKTFTPDAADSSTTLEFTFPEGRAGTSLVIFERLYDAENNLVATHEDINDEAQTVGVYDVPRIGTFARAAGDNELVSFKGGQVIDTVTYENLIGGNQYTLPGELMDKAPAKEPASPQKRRSLPRNPLELLRCCLRCLKATQVRIWSCSNTSTMPKLTSLLSTQTLMTKDKP